MPTFVEFLGLAGVGQAEAASLKSGGYRVGKPADPLQASKDAGDIRRPNLSRSPTVPATAADGGGPRPAFAIKDAKKALQAACERLGYARFSQRSIRRFLIGQLWKSGVDRKLIAKWQGHRDGGKLIIDTYTEVFGDDDSLYEQQQLAKLRCAA